MDLLGAVTAIFGRPLAQILSDVWQDFRTGRQIRRGMAVNPGGYQREIPNVSGFLSVPESDYVDWPEREPPIFLTGGFFADESFLDFTDFYLEEEEKRIVMLIQDLETEEVYFFELGFDGYAISVWPGDYNLYAFIVDPILDEALGFGYPFFRDLRNPNPLLLEGEGPLRLNFIIFDIEDLA